MPYFENSLIPKKEYIMIYTAIKSAAIHIHEIDTNIRNAKRTKVPITIMKLVNLAINAAESSAASLAIL